MKTFDVRNTKIERSISHSSIDYAYIALDQESNKWNLYSLFGRIYVYDSTTESWFRATKDKIQLTSMPFEQAYYLLQRIKTYGKILNEELKNVHYTQ